LIGYSDRKAPENVIDSISRMTWFQEAPLQETRGVRMINRESRFRRPFPIVVIRRASFALRITTRGEIARVPRGSVYESLALSAERDVVPFRTERSTSAPRAIVVAAHPRSTGSR